MNFNGVDFDTYFKHYPDKNGFFGKYGGSFVNPELQKAMDEIGPNYEVTRFKGLGEISSSEFKEFIGPKMRLEPVKISAEEPIHTMLEFYMGSNTPERQGFIIDNLRIEADYVDELR